MGGTAAGALIMTCLAPFVFVAMMLLLGPAVWWTWLVAPGCFAVWLWLWARATVWLIENGY